jgi:hypothetical protein
LLIIAWHDQNPIISVLHLMFITMSQDRLMNAVVLSIVCEPDVVDGKDYFELALQISGALCDASSGTLRDKIQRLFCSRQITRFFTLFSSRSISDRD